MCQFIAKCSLYLLVSLALQCLITSKQLSHQLNFEDHIRLTKNRLIRSDSSDHSGTVDKIQSLEKNTMDTFSKNDQKNETSIVPGIDSFNQSEAHAESNGTKNNSTVNTGRTLLHRPNNGAILRGFYVFIGLSGIVVIYIFVRTIRLRRKKTTVRKYGILASREDMEMTPLGAEEDDDDTTLFDVNNHSRQ